MANKSQKSKKAAPPKSKEAPQEKGEHRTVFQDGKVHRLPVVRKPGHAEEPREFKSPGHVTSQGKKEKAK